MKTKSLRSFLTCTIIIFSSLCAFAQGGARMQEKKENIEAMKIAYITKALDLSPEEAQKFWPVYNQYSDKLQELRKKRRQDLRENRENFDGMTDKEIEAAVDAEMSTRQKELDLQKEYHTKFKAVLPIRKVAKLYIAEEQFKRVLLEKLKEKKEARGK